ncbi:MAG: polyphosphate kinase [Rhodospirillaceae bacterium]|nr:polyphosphate kinase [Rhodospirillaceae bacterium]
MDHLNFKAAEIGATLSDDRFRALKDRLRLDLIAVQQKARSLARFPIVIVLAGVRGAGVIDTLNLLNTWMDPRWIESHAFDGPTPEEQGRPPLWRYWRTLPANGTIGLYLSAWHSQAIAAGARRNGAADFKAHIRRIRAFERTLTDTGALVLKFWLHVDEAIHKAATGAHKIDPVFGFRTSDAALPPQPPYKAMVKTAAELLAATHTDAAPWHVVEGTDDNFRRASVLSILKDALTAHTAAWEARGKKDDIPGALPPELPEAKRLPPLEKLRMPRLSGAAYCRAFPEQQHRVYAAQKAAHAAGIPCVAAFEGWDAAGKGGAIRRLTYSLNAFNFHVVPIAAPTDEEAAHHYLWRFWRQLPPAGGVTIFDRTWYGRVLVERIDKFARKPEWKRAYAEINDFERSLADAGVVLLKFWMHVTKKEQKRRLLEREETSYKQWKLSGTDWHAHKQYREYLEAADEMRARCSRVPWHVIPGDDKHYARIKVLETVANALEKAVAKKR